MTQQTNKFRREHLTEAIKNFAGDFFARNASKQSLLTVTNVWVSEDLKKADIFISVLPEKHSAAALDFAKRQRADLQNFLRTKIKLRHLPLLDIVLDKSSALFSKQNR